MNDFDIQIVVSADHPSLIGHFPGNPVVPGVVLLDQVLEAVRRTLSHPIELAKIVSTKFQRAVTPGLAIDVSVKFQAESSAVLKARFVGRCENAPVFEGSMLLRISSSGDAR